MSAVVRLLVSDEDSIPFVCGCISSPLQPHCLTHTSHFDRLSSAIPTRAWPSLTRHFHPSDSRLFLDSKVGSSPVIYVSDASEISRFSLWLSSHPDLSIRVLPSLSSVADFAALAPGVLALLPDSRFLVPGGRFNEMYGWDSFFIAKGLLGHYSLSDKSQDSLSAKMHVDDYDTTSPLRLAIDQLRNLSYQVLSFGKIHNATRSYFVNRSNPPFLSSLVKAVLDASNLATTATGTGTTTATTATTTDTTTTTTTTTTTLTTTIYTTFPKKNLPQDFLQNH